MLADARKLELVGESCTTIALLVTELASVTAVVTTFAPDAFIAVSSRISAVSAACLNISTLLSVLAPENDTMSTG